MLLFAYLLIFFAVSATLTWWRVASYRSHFEGAPALLVRDRHRGR